MNFLEVKSVHKAVFSPIGDLTTWRAFPTQKLDHMDPFLLLNHHGPQEYPPNNQGLPFGPHPHRGFETLTFILQGDITHKDSGGGGQTITAGGIQWMTAGRGLVHEEVSSPSFKKSGGVEEVIQLWMNLPSKYKMVQPHYAGIAEENIPVVEIDEGRVRLHLISGKWEDVKAPINSLTGLFTSRLQCSPGGRFVHSINPSHQVLLYVVNGNLKVNGHKVATHEILEFVPDRSVTSIEITAEGETTAIFCHGEPFNEPIVSQGPFVMNSEEEIFQAFEDYRSGKFGSW